MATFRINSNPLNAIRSTPERMGRNIASGRDFARRTLGRVPNKLSAVANVLGSTSGGRFVSSSFRTATNAMDRFISPMRNIGGARSLVGGVMGSAALIAATKLASVTVETLFGRKLSKVRPGTSVVTGKRGIDANHLNASGVSLAMHRNRRSF